MAQRTQLNRPYGLKHEDDLVRDITALFTANAGLTTKVLEMGDWNMDDEFGFAPTIAHGLSATEWKNIRSTSMVIRDDDDAVYSGMPFVAGGDAWISYIDGTNIYLGRDVGGTFDDTGYDSTSYNRGWVTIQYIAD